MSEAVSSSLKVEVVMKRLETWVIGAGGSRSALLNLLLVFVHNDRALLHSFRTTSHARASPSMEVVQDDRCRKLRSPA